MVRALVLSLLLVGCTTAPARADYPAHWWAPADRATAPAWEVLPQDAGPGEVILSKRNELGLMSNFAATPFVYAGKRYASLEGFWQAMLYPENASDPRAAAGTEWKFTRAEVEQMVAFDAKHAGELAKANMKKLGIDWASFEGKRFPYKSIVPGEHYRLIVEATHAKLEQNKNVYDVLMSTGDLHLKPDHKEDAASPPEWRYFELYENIRDQAGKRVPRKRVPGRK